MQPCSLGLILIIISILTGAKTLSTSGNSESAILQDQQPKLLPVKSLCLLHCANERKVISEECVQDCQEELESDHTQDGREKVIDKSLIRSQRSVKNKMNLVTNECKFSPDYPDPHTVNGLRADFTSNKSHVKIIWEAMDPSKTDFNWTTYAVIYAHSTEKKSSCRVVPQNQTQYLVPQEHWKYPDPFYVQVVTHPYNGESSMELKHFDPLVGKRVFTPTIAEKDTSKLVTSIVGGVIAGLVLLVALCFAIKWKKYRRCPEINYAQPPPAPQRTEDGKEMYYACYYPEGEEFREKVASIVNYFRQNGYNVIMDVMVTGEITAQGPTRWAENQMRSARKVLVFLTPGLVNLSQDVRCDSSQSQDINRVWIELEVLRDIYTRNRSASKMVCITLPNTPVKSMALPLWAKVSYKWPVDAQEILKRLNSRPKILPV